MDTNYIICIEAKECKGIDNQPRRCSASWPHLCEIEEDRLHYCSIIKKGVKSKRISIPYINSDLV